jgi:VIT1/CCC1 family predicted Fe2+/Mn2+ transporter
LTEATYSEAILSIILNEESMKEAYKQMITGLYDEEHDHHSRIDPHRKGASGLSDIILGGQDGLVNVLGVILGVAAATSDPRIVLVAGLAATFAESVSMGAVAFTSTIADADYYDSEKERELRHIKRAPRLEREEVRQIYSEKGFEGDLLNRIVDTITSDPEVWVAVMMSEEHRLTPIDRREGVKVAFIVGFSAIVGSLIPLAPFAFLPVNISMWVSVLITALVLFGVGAIKAQLTIGSPTKSGFEMAVIGTLSALVGYGVGMFLKIPTTP